MKEDEREVSEPQRGEKEKERKTEDCLILDEKKVKEGKQKSK